ncbi:MAG: hypothetical protein GY862_18950 [Gammaproteobacteria bacterium]|nr:hypothetical protein [Gammaproteobacteria bacterium]
MPKFTFSELSRENLSQIAKVDEKGVVLDRWKQMESESTVQEKQQINLVQSHLAAYRLTLMNEATIWARAIYPILLLAESGNIQAWAQVNLNAQYPHFELNGLIDGVVGDCASGTITTPYLVVAEAKRGLEAGNPQYQLYGEMLAAAWLNRQKQADKTQQEIYGCYTVSDTWTFMHGIVSEFDADCPAMTVESSKEYVQRNEAETILHILKHIIN